MTDHSAELIEQVATARNEKKQLSIIGRGTKDFIGRNVLDAGSGRVSNTICTAKHAGIVEYHAAELTITVRAGTKVSDIQTVLAEQGQTLSFEPPTFSDQASIGGTLACNLSGPARPWAGSIRDMVLGLRLVNGKAEHLKFGGQVIKNVAGYDVSRLQAGGLGTLGIITEISFKVMPKPAASLSLIQAMDAEEAISVMNKLAAQSLPLTAACWLNNNLYLRLSGTNSAVHGAAKKLSGAVFEHADNFWESLREYQCDYFSASKSLQNPKALWRFSIKSTSKHYLHDENWLIDWGGAQRWLQTDKDKIERTELEKFAVENGGQLSLFRGGDRSSEVFHPQSTVMQTLLRRVKKSFDPEGVFNSGRLYSWL